MTIIRNERVKNCPVCGGCGSSCKWKSWQEAPCLTCQGKGWVTVETNKTPIDTFLNATGAFINITHGRS